MTTLFETSRLSVRHLESSDLADMFSLFGDPSVTRWMDDGSPLTRELCQKWIEVSQRNYQTKGFGASAVIEKASGRFVGCSGIVYAPDRQFPEIIYAFLPETWGRGFASELVPAMLAYGFSDCGLPRLLATIDSQNSVSQRVVLKAGMTLVGQELESDGQITLVYQLENLQE